MQIARVKLLHLIHQPDERFESHNGCAARTTARAASLLQRSIEGRSFFIEVRQQLFRLLLQIRGVMLAGMVQPCIQMFRLVLYGICRKRRSGSFDNVGRRPSHVASGSGHAGAFFFAPIFHQLVQQLAVYIEVAHGRRGAAYLFEKSQPFTGHAGKRFIGAFAQKSLNHSLNTPRAGAHVMHRVYVRIGHALLQIFTQRCGQRPKMLQMRIWSGFSLRPVDGRAHYADILNLGLIMVDSILPGNNPRKPALLSSAARTWTLLLLVFLAVHFAALFTPSLLDDADATHANAAQHMAQSGDWVTLYVNGIRYLEKPPLPYWMAAIDYHIFGYNTFATHLPETLAVLACSVLAWLWGRRAYSERAAFYAALGVLTSFGVFIWTRFFIPESILTFFIALALYLFLTGLEDRKPGRIYGMYAALAIAVLAKGLIAPVFFLAATIPYLLISGEWRKWRRLRLLTGLLLFLAIAAPWHILAGIRNPDHGNPVGNVPTPGHVHGFFYFYFINEHVLRFLGKRYPHDYNKQPFLVFWLGQLVWLFPWSLYFPVALRRAWRNRKLAWADVRYDASNTLHFLDARSTAHEAAGMAARVRFRARTGLLLTIYAAFILIFFGISTNQEYYTWPAYFPLLLLTAGALGAIEEAPEAGRWINAKSKWLTGAHAAFAVIGIAIAIALGSGLWASRNLPFEPDIGTLLAHRGVGSYSLASSHFFDLTGPSFAALRLPAALAAVTLLIGPVVAWYLRKRGHSFESTVSVAFTAAVFLIAAHIAFVRFEPMLSSRAFANTINRLDSPADQLIIYGDQADGSSIIFYTHRQALLVNGVATSMIWGSCYPDAPHIFLQDKDLLSIWGNGPRKFLFVPGDRHDHVEALLAGHLYKLQELSDKTLYTDRPL